MTNAGQIRLDNIGLAYIFQARRTIINILWNRKKNNKYLGPVSTMRRLLTQKDGGLASYFDKIEKREAGMTNSPLKHMPNDNHTNEENKGKIGANLPLDRNFGFCETFKKRTKGLGFELRLQTSNEKQSFIYTTLGDNHVKVTVKSLYLYTPSLFPSPGQHFLLNQLGKVLLYLLIHG